MTPPFFMVDLFFRWGLGDTVAVPQTKILLTLKIDGTGRRAILFGKVLAYFEG